MVNWQGELESHNSVARHCRRRDVGNDGVPPPDVFLVRDGEPYLSTNWCEYFHPSDRRVQVDGIVDSLRKKRTVKRGDGIIVLRVGPAIDACRTSLDIDLQFWVLGEFDDPSHTGIFGLFDEYKARIAHTLAMSVNEHDVHPVED